MSIFKLAQSCNPIVPPAAPPLSIRQPDSCPMTVYTLIYNMEPFTPVVQVEVFYCRVESHHFAKNVEPEHVARQCIRPYW